MDILIKLAYLVAAVLFILGIKRMGRTKDARSGNTLSAIGMTVAIVATLLQIQLLTLPEILIAMVIGSAIGWFMASRVQMTKMPEMVALFNGFGGLASVVVALSEYWGRTQIRSEELPVSVGLPILLSVLIGGVTFTGSIVAYGKLSGKIKGNAIVFKGQHFLNLLVFLAAITFGAFVFSFQAGWVALLFYLVLSFLLGVLAVIPIGGADMPVVISLLNSYSGMAACTTGFILNNPVLIITGALVGASGIILTQIMCKAMNRSLVSVLLGGFGTTSASGTSEAGKQMTIREVSPEEAAMIFDSASSVIIVPGYGLAVAQAQHVIKELTDLLEQRNIAVKFAIHPVAGRMPGHMNVLLAEANVSYDKLIEMELINDDFANTDVVFVVGANDVVNPAARHDKNSPIYGMPILNADKARTVIVSKRSMAAGYAGVENELFGADNCLMLFGDARKTITTVVGELKG